MQDWPPTFSCLSYLFRLCSDGKQVLTPQVLAIGSRYVQERPSQNFVQERPAQNFVQDLCRLFEPCTPAQTNPTPGLTLILTLSLTLTLWGARGRQGQSHISAACFGGVFPKKRLAAERPALTNKTASRAKRFVQAAPAHRSELHYARYSAANRGRMTAAAARCARSRHAQTGPLPA